MKIEKDIQEVQSSLTRLFKRFGLRDVDANVLAHIIIFNRELTVSELSSSLNQSISGVTSALHRLMRMHLVVRNKVGKKYVYRTESNILTVLLNLIEDVRMHEIRELKILISRKLQGERSEVLSSLHRRVENAERNLEELAKILRERGGDSYANSSNS